MAIANVTEKPAGVRREVYRGVDTAAVYSDSRDEFRALRRGAGVYDLCWRTKLLVSGKDRVRWLNNMATNNVRDLPVGQGNYSFVLTPQGRILGDLYAYNRGDFLVIDVDQSQAENLVPILRRYIIMDNVELTNAGEKLLAIGVAGPRAQEVLSSLGLDVSDMKNLELRDSKLDDIELTVVRGDLPAVPCFEIWTEPSNSNRLWQELVKAGATPAGSEAFELLRIACGVPRYGQDIRERDLPQETEQFRALNFTKGCYIGQEIVERIRSRGAVHRKFTGFKIEGPLPAPGEKAQADGRDVAEITSSALLLLDDSNLPVALGYVRREVGNVGTQIQVGGANATVLEVPIVEAFAPSAK